MKTHNHCCNTLRQINNQQNMYLMKNYLVLLCIQEFDIGRNRTGHHKTMHQEMNQIGSESVFNITILLTCTSLFIEMNRFNN